MEAEIAGGAGRCLSRFSVTIWRYIDGESRPKRSGYDLGADEFWWEMVYLPLVRK